MKNKQHNQNQLFNKNLLTRGKAYKEKGKKNSQGTSVNTKVVFTPKAFEEVVLMLPGESQRQYETLRLYCQEDSLVQLSKNFESLLKGGNCPRVILNNRGKPASLRTLERWSKKFDWIERKDAWVHEECEKMYYSSFMQPKRPSPLMAVKLHQNATKTTPEIDGRKRVNECK